jgi:hypothetical protein
LSVRKRVIDKNVQISGKIGDFFSSKNKKNTHKKCTFYCRTPLSITLKQIYFFEKIGARHASFHLQIHASLASKNRALLSLKNARIPDFEEMKLKARSGTCENLYFAKFLRRLLNEL